MGVDVVENYLSMSECFLHCRVCFIRFKHLGMTSMIILGKKGHGNP